MSAERFEEMAKWFRTESLARLGYEPKVCGVLPELAALLSSVDAAAREECAKVCDTARSEYERHRADDYEHQETHGYTNRELLAMFTHKMECAASLARKIRGVDQIRLQQASAIRSTITKGRE